MIVKPIFLRSIFKRIFILISLFLIILSGFFLLPLDFKNINSSENLSDNVKILNKSAGDNIILQGTEEPINCTDKSIYEVSNQEVSVTNESEQDLSYYLDEANGWKISKIVTQINNIQDTRNWVANGEFNDVSEAPYIVYQVFENKNDSISHNYNNSLNHDPLEFYSECDVQSQINHPGAIAMRVHFKNISLIYNEDYIFIYSNISGGSWYDLWYTDTGSKTDFYSPWIKGDSLAITMNTSDSQTDYGYYIDFYEFYNATSSYIDLSNLWGASSANFPERNPLGYGRDYGTNIIDGKNAMYIYLNSFRSWSDTYKYFYGGYILLDREWLSSSLCHH